MEGISIFSGNSNPVLAKNICEYLNLSLGDAQVKTFSDGEIQIEIEENVRSKDVFVVQSTCAPVNDHLVELLLMIDAFKRASARRITAVIPYFGYARQDKKVAPRVPISAKLVANMLTVSGANRIITMDLHAGQIQGFFDIPVDNIFAAPILIEYIRQNFNNNIVIVSPDAGGVERARAFAKRLDADLAIIDKRRSAPNQAKAMAVIGDVKNKVVVILDDMADTAGTLTEAAQALKAAGAGETAPAPGLRLKSAAARCRHSMHRNSFETAPIDVGVLGVQFDHQAVALQLGYHATGGLGGDTHHGANVFPGGQVAMVP